MICKLKKIMVLMLTLCIALGSMCAGVWADDVDEEDMTQAEIEALEKEIAEQKMAESGQAVSENTEQESETSEVSQVGAEEPKDEITEKETVADNGYSEAENRKIQLLSALGIVKLLPDAEKIITRGEFAEYLSFLANVDLTFGDVTYFKDVKKSNSYIKGINTVYTLGLMNGVNGQSFCPDDEMSYNNAIVALIRLLGYGVTAENNGGYPGGYMQTASKLGLNAGNSSDDGKITGRALINLLYNSLFIEILEEARFTGSEAIYEKSDYKLLESNFGYKKYRGQIVADSFATIGGRKTCGENQLVIKSDGQDYIFDVKSTEEIYIGSNVEYYANDEDEIIYITERANEDVLVIDAYDIQEVDNYIRKITYYDENSGKTKSAEIEAVADFVYNGVNDTLLSSEVENANGEIRLTDTDGDGEYDLVFVTNYQYFLAKVITDEGVLVDVRTGISYDLHTEDSDYHTAFIKYGLPVSVGMISADETVSVLSSKNTEGKKKLTAYVKDELRQGTVNSISELSVEIDGIEYDCAKGFSSDALYIGDHIFFMLDDSGRICLYKKEYSGKRTYIYITGYKEKTVIASTCSIRAMNDSGEFSVYDFAENYKVNGKKGEAKDVKANVFGGGEDVLPQLAAVELDGEGKITAIEFDYTPDGATPADSKNVFTYNAVLTTSLYDNSRNVLGGEYWKNSDTKVFVLYTDNMGNIIEDASSDGTREYKTMQNRKKVPMHIYDAFDENRIAGALVLKVSLSELTTFYSYDGWFIVEKIIDKLNDEGETVKAAVGYHSGARTAIMGEPGFYDVSNWKPGEIYSVMKSKAGSILTAGKIFALNKSESDSATMMYYGRPYGPDEEAFSSSDKITGMSYGSLRNVTTDGVRAVYIGVEGSGKTYTYSISSSTRFYKYDVANKKCEAVTVDALVPGEGKVLTSQEYGILQNLIVFK